MSPALRIPEECFDYHEPEITTALEKLNYSHYLTEHRRILLGCVPHRASGDPPLASWGDWYVRWSS